MRYLNLLLASLVSSSGVGEAGAVRDGFARATKRRGGLLPHSSCTAKLENDIFLGKMGHRTLLHIVTTCAFNISAYSVVPKEDECAQAPGH